MVEGRTSFAAAEDQSMHMSLMIVRSGWEIHVIPSEIVGVRAVLPGTKDPPSPAVTSRLEVGTDGTAVSDGIGTRRGM
eukprot:scaffold74999_cov61-Cyclotella_meneghiniana.AAC.1